MATLYDIGDNIKITLDGKVVGYSASKNGDSYTIELTDPAQGGNRAYLSTENLKGRSSKIDVDKKTYKPYDYFMDPIGIMR